MTYRRLFRYLVIVSTVLLVLLEWQAMKGPFMGALSSSQRYYWFGLSPGTAVLHYSCEYQAATPSEADHPGFLELFAFPNPLSMRLQSSFFQPRKPGSRGLPRLLVGDFRMDSQRGKNGWWEADPYHVTFRLELPLWGPWLVFVTGAFVICCLMERRTARGLEKKLAETDAPDRVTGDTA